MWGPLTVSGSASSASVPWPRVLRFRLCPELSVVASGSRPFEHPSSCRPSLCCRPPRVVRPRLLCPELPVVVSGSRPLEHPSSCRPAMCCHPRRVVRPRLLCPEFRVVVAGSCPFEHPSSGRLAQCCRPPRVVRPRLRCPEFRVVDGGSRSFEQPSSCRRALCCHLPRGVRPRLLCPEFRVVVGGSCPFEHPSSCRSALCCRPPRVVRPRLLWPDFRVDVSVSRPWQHPSSGRPAPHCPLRGVVRPRLCLELRVIFSASLPLPHASASLPSLCCSPRRVVSPCLCPQLRVVVAVLGVSRQSSLRSSSLVSPSSSSFVLILASRLLLAPSRVRHSGNIFTVLHAAVSGSPWLRSRCCRRAFSLRLRFAARAGTASVVVFWLETFCRTWVAVFRRGPFWSAYRRLLPVRPTSAPPPPSLRLFGFPGAHQGLALSVSPEAPGAPSSAAWRPLCTANVLRAGLPRLCRFLPCCLGARRCLVP